MPWPGCARNKACLTVEHDCGIRTISGALKEPLQPEMFSSNIVLMPLTEPASQIFFRQKVFGAHEETRQSDPFS